MDARSACRSSGTRVWGGAEGDRREYFDVLKAAQLNENAGPFAEFILVRAIRALEHFGSYEGQPF